ncbi:putative ribonuclease H-like domain-containing protein [Tanacetum coccineum]
MACFGSKLSIQMLMKDVGQRLDYGKQFGYILMHVSPIPTTRVHKDHPVKQIIKDLNSAPQTRRMTKNLEEHEEPKKVIHALKDPSWIEAMQDELLQFKLQKVWTLVELPNGKRVIGTKWDKRGIVIKNKAILVAQGYTHEEGINYDEVFAPVARIETIRLYLAYASFKDFVVYQMDVKSTFLYGSRAWYETLSTYLLNNGFQRGNIDKTLFIRRDKDDAIKKLSDELYGVEITFFLGCKVKQKDDGIFISQDIFDVILKENLVLPMSRLQATYGNSYGFRSRIKDG